MATQGRHTLPLPDDVESIAPPSSTKSKFLTIPREMRDKIYHYIGIDELLYLKYSKLPAIFLVNKQIHDEFKEVLYSHKIPVMKATYLDDNRGQIWRPVPSWLLSALLLCSWRSHSFRDGTLDPEDPGSRRTKSEALRQITKRRTKPEASMQIAKRRKEQISRSEQARIPRFLEDGDSSILERFFRDDDPAMIARMRQDELDRRELLASRFWGYLELVGDGRIIALFTFEKFLLSEDVWMKVHIKEDDTLWFRSEPYRTNKATDSQREKAQRAASGICTRARVCDFPVDVVDAVDFKCQPQ